MKPWPRRSAQIASLLALLASSGCITQHVYTGQTRERAELAVIEPAIGIAGTQIMLKEIDGQPLGWLYDRAAVLPGRHQLRAHMVLRSGLAQRSHDFNLWFEVQPGGRYLIFGEISAHGPRLWLTDAELRTVAEVDPGLPPDVSAPPGAAAPHHTD